MRALPGLVAGLSLMSLSACTSDPPGEPCPSFTGFTWDAPTVMCGGDAFENLDNYTAWRDIPESGPCPGARCDDIEIVVDTACPRLWVGDFIIKGSDPTDGDAEIRDVRPGVRYTLQAVDYQFTMSSMADGIQCLRAE